LRKDAAGAERLACAAKGPNVTERVAWSKRRLPGSGLAFLYVGLLVGVGAFVEFFIELVGSSIDS